MKDRLSFLLFFLLFPLTACSVAAELETAATPTGPTRTPVVEETPTPELAGTPVVPANGSDIVDLLSDPPPPNEGVEIDAYFSGANPYIAPGGPWRYYEDRINCPYYLNNLLTDAPFEAGLTVLHRGMSNKPADEAPWLLAATQETAQPNAHPEADLPYHARLRGRLGDPVFAGCENRDRIFLVEEVVIVYEQNVPDPPLNMWELPPDFAQWPRYENESLGFSFSYPPDWQIEPVDDPALSGSLLVRYPERPNFPVMVRIYPQEPILDDMGRALEPPPLADISMMSFVQGDGAGAMMPHNQHLIGYIGETTPKPDSRYLTVYFLGDGRSPFHSKFPAGTGGSVASWKSADLLLVNQRGQRGLPG